MRTAGSVATRAARWEWRDLHVALFEHPISSVVDDALARPLQVGPVPLGGGDEVVGDTAFVIDDPDAKFRTSVRRSRSPREPHSARSSTSVPGTAAS
jgi:hypothetical protein